MEKRGGENGEERRGEGKCLGEENNRREEGEYRRGKGKYLEERREKREYRRGEY